MTKQAEAKAEATEQEADRVSEEAASASDNANGKQTHLQAAEANDKAAQANWDAAKAHQAHGDAGGEDAAGSAANYADTPSEAAYACMTEVDRFKAEAAWHRKQANKGEAGEGALGALLALAMVGVGGAAVVFTFGPAVQAMIQGLLAGLAF